MKCGTFILLANFLYATVANTNLYGQLAKVESLNKNSLINIDPGSKDEPEASSYKLTVSRRVNPKAMRNFLKEYKNIDSVCWYQTENGASASFIKDEIQTVTYYDKDGNRTIRRISYNRNKIPGDFRRFIKPIYYDYEIYCLVALEYRDHTIYAITLENKTTWIQLEVVDFEIQSVKKFLKSE